MKRVTTALLLSLSISTFSSFALAQAGGEGGSSAAGAAGESSAGGNSAGADGEAGAEGSPDAGPGDAGPGDAGTDAGPKDLDLLENDGGRACSLGRASGGEGLLVAFALATIAVASRRRAKKL